ncbi:MAG TPA: hypothetical protein VNO70_20735 [Blastocatellia bacterium]|nr:hypothetical protein [Blastocatellia bacterium]
MPQEKLIQSGQFTLPRLLFLAVAAGIIVGAVALGGVFLSVGYLLITLALCVLLFLIAIDYGVNIDKVNPQTPTAQATAQAPVPATESAIAPEAAAVTASEARPRRRANRPAKRRR